MKQTLPPLSAALLALVLSQSAGAQGADTQTTTVAPVLLERISGNREQFIARLVAPLRRHGGEDQALEESEITVLMLSEQANRRAARVQTLLRYDLNGNAQVTAEEIRTVLNLRPHTTRAKQRIVQQLTRYDSSGDGVISVQEALDYTQPANTSRFGRWSTGGRLKQLLALDPNGDGKLTADELVRLGRAAYAVYDTDGNGVLSREERRSLQNDKRKLRRRPPLSPRRLLRQRKPGSKHI